MSSSVSEGDAVASTEGSSRQPSDTIPSEASGTTTSAEKDDVTTTVAKLLLTGKKPKLPPQIEVKELAPAQNIHAAIPKEGIEIQELARKFGVDSSNYHLFVELLKKIAILEVSAIVKPAKNLPSPSELEELEIAAKEPPIPRVLRKNQTVLSQLLGAPIVTWDDSEALVRGASNILPRRLYRVFHEDSATLSAYMTKHNYVKSRDLPYLNLSKDVAFQAIGSFSAQKDLTRPRIERHLIWNQKTQPSSYISAFNNLSDAHRRLKFHSRIGDNRMRQSKRIGERLALAVIDTSNFVAMTVHADVEEKVITWVTTYMALFGRFSERNPTKAEVVTRHVQIPVWVHKSVLEGRDDAKSMTLKELEDARPEMWLSITELRRCNLKVPATRGHHYEWLACGRIPLSSIKKVVPFDGKKLHWRPNKKNIRSSHGEHCWLWDNTKSRWVLDLEWERRKDAERHTNVPGQASSNLDNEEELSEGDADSIASDSDEEIAGVAGAGHEQMTTNRKRKNNTEEVARMEKRPRLGGDESSAETVACVHQCTSWCRIGYNEQEAQYAMAWEAFANASGLASNATPSDERV